MGRTIKAKLCQSKKTTLDFCWSLVILFKIIKMEELTKYYPVNIRFNTVFLFCFNASHLYDTGITVNISPTPV